jgi:hypothetical protein
MKCFVIPVIVGATGTVSKSLKISGNNTRITFNNSVQEKKLIRNITHHKESATI